MNKEYFVLEIEDTSSAEYRKNYWKKAAEILLERIYQREQCISEKVKNIIELCSLPEHRFFNVDVYMPKKGIRQIPTIMLYITTLPIFKMIY